MAEPVRLAPAPRLWSSLMVQAIARRLQEKALGGLKPAAVARANQWLTELLSARSSSSVEIGRRAGVGKRYVSRIIRLDFLAPSIIEEIARGHQPPVLTAQTLSTRRGDLPLSWQAQRELLGFHSA